MLLAIDTSTSQMGLALVDEGQILAEFTWKGNLMHTVELAPTVQEIFQKTGIEAKNLNGLGVATGPGSFTSLRVGLSFIKGLAFSLGIPVAGINSLLVQACAVTPHEDLPLMCTLPAGRGRHACNTFSYSARKKWHPNTEPHISTAQEIADTITEQILFCGELSNEERSVLKHNEKITLLDAVFCTRRPALLGWLAEKQIKKGEADDLFSLAPSYLHIGPPIAAEQ